MSMSAALFYGYDLGSEYNEWKFVEFDDDLVTYKWPSWMEADEYGEVEDVIDDMEKRLKKLYPESGITFEMYGSTEFGWVMGFLLFESDGALEVLEDVYVNPDMTQRRSWDRKLEGAIAALDIKLEGKPQLLALNCHY